MEAANTGHAGMMVAAAARSPVPLSVALLEAWPHPVAMMDLCEQQIRTNRHWQQLYGPQLRDGLRGLLADLPRAWRPALQALMQRIAGQGQAAVESTRVSDLDGRSWQLQLQLNYRAGAPACWILHLLAQSAPASAGLPAGPLQEQLLDASADCIKVINLDGSLRHINRAGSAALGLSEGSQAPGLEWLGLLPANLRSRAQRALRLALAGRPARFSGKRSTALASHQYWDSMLSPMRDVDGRITGILCVSRNITAKHAIEQRLRRSTELDVLTGLPNRYGFMRSVCAAIEQDVPHRGLGLLLIDLDHFRHLNDSLGQLAGDHVLEVLAQRLLAVVGSRGRLARLGGDEFAILLADVGDASELAQLAGNVRELTAQSITWQDRVLNVGMSIGCALYPHDGGDAEQLLRAAHTALNDLKLNGRGGVRMYSTPLLQAAEQAANQLRLAREILRNDAVLPYYQPKVRLSDGVQVGFEALLRWCLPDEGGLVGSCQMDEAFADYELAVGLAEQMHNKVLADIAGWLAQGLPVLPVAINASPVEFLRDDFAESLLARIRRHQVPTALVEVEITEQVLADHGAACVIRALHQLKEAGVRIALDDFGTGHSSLAHLRDYPIDCLKIDRSFISRMESEPSIRAIIQAVATLGPSLQLDLVAEGVENIRQRELLLQAGCLLGQGFLYAPALPALAVAQRLRQAQTPVLLAMC